MYSVACQLVYRSNCLYNEHTAWYSPSVLSLGTVHLVEAPLTLILVLLLAVTVAGEDLPTAILKQLV